MRDSPLRSPRADRRLTKNAKKNKSVLLASALRIAFFSVFLALCLLQTMNINAL